MNARRALGSTYKDLKLGVVLYLRLSCLVLGSTYKDLKQHQVTNAQHNSQVRKYL